MVIAETNQGYNIEAAEIYSGSGDNARAVVLAHNEETNMWATWECTKGNYFYWGHYFDAKNDAMKDYHARLLNNYDLPWKE